VTVLDEWNPGRDRCRRRKWLTDQVFRGWSMIGLTSILLDSGLFVK
jgi:hypothetical protein